jgi:GAF domain-containing protein
MNKKGASAGAFVPFSVEDEMLGEHMALQIGIILSNHLLTERTNRAHGQVVSLLQIVKSLHSNMGINSLMFTITERSPGLVDADRCTLYLVDRNRNELWSLQGAVEIRSPIDKGLAGACASSGQIINIEDVYKDERFNQDYDKKTGYRTRSVLVLPIFDNPMDGSKRQVVGVLQMINKLHGSRFSDSDEQLLSSFLDIAGSILVTSQLFNRAEKKVSEFEAAKSLTARGEGGKPGELGKQASGRLGGRSSAVKATMAISEGLEEEE